jgi:hypothetical protein
MLNEAEVRERILAKMKELGFKLDAEGARGGVLADLLAELVAYIVEKNEVQVDPGSGKGKFG